MERVQLLNGDCLELMKNISDKSIDMILCDLPYG
jgi:DNA modification methylase